MRSILALGLLITLFAFADSAAASHSQRQVRAKGSVTVGTVPGFANAPAVR